MYNLLILHYLFSAVTSTGKGGEEFGKAGEGKGGKDPEKADLLKDLGRSIEMREAGNSLLKAGKLGEALKMYNLAVLAAPMHIKVKQYK